MYSLTLLISEQEDVEGVCGSALTDLSVTPEFSDRLSQGKRLEMWSAAFSTVCVMGHVLTWFLSVFEWAHRSQTYDSVINRSIKNIWSGIEIFVFSSRNEYRSLAITTDGAVSGIWCVFTIVCYGGVSGSPQLEPLPPELPPRAPLDESDGRLLSGGGAGLGTPFAETPDATGTFLH